MIVRAAVYLLAVLFSIYLFFMYDGHIWTGLLLLEVLYPLCSCLFLWNMGRNITVRFGRFPAMAERAKQFSGILILKNNSRIWNVRYRVRAHVNNHFSKPVRGRSRRGFGSPKGLPLKFAPALLGPSQEQRLEIGLESQYAGTLECCLESFLLYDMLGIFYRTVSVQQRRTVGIMPPFELMPLEITRRTREFLADVDEYSTEKQGDDPSEIYQVREYRPTDSIHSIHWKLSAKEDQLMVKEHGFPMGCVVLLWIRLPLADTDSAGFSRLLERAASLSVTLLEEKCIHMAAWFEEKNGQVVKWRVDTAESVYEWIWRLLSTEPFQDEALERTCYEDAFRGEHFSSTVILHADGTLTVNGEEQELLQL